MSGRALSPRLPLVGWLLIGYVALFAAYILLAPGSQAYRRPVVDLGQAVAPLIASLLCWSAAQRSTSNSGRSSWRLLALANAAWVLGQITWSYQEMVDGRSLPTPSVSDLFWALYYPLAFGGIMLQVRRGQSFYNGLTSTFDALLLTLAAGGLSWQFLLEPYLASSADPVQALVGISWPVGDLLLVYGLVSLSLRWPLEKVPAAAAYLLAGFAVQIVVDTAFTLLVLNGTYQTGHPIDSLWQWTFALLGLAALSHLRAEGEGSQAVRWPTTINLGWTRGARILLPYMALPVAFLLLYIGFRYATQDTGGDPATNLAIALALIGLVMLRQSLMLLENHKLSVTLTALSQELEARVVHRTQELTYRTEELTHRTADLAALNQVSTRLSHCATSEEVLSVGIALACEATGLSAGAVWLLRPDRRTDLVAHQGLPTAFVPQLTDILKLAPSLRDTLASGKAIVLRKSDLIVNKLPGQVSQQTPLRIVAVPLLSRGTVFGILGLFRQEEGLHEGSELQLASAIGAQLGVALESARRYEEAKYLADRDSVTGLLNHRAIHEQLEQELKRSQRSGQRFSLLMLDLDGFKLFNDTYGHPIGDQILRQVAAGMAENARGSDILARYGGDEFMVLLPDTDAEGAIALAERLREYMTANPYTAPDGVAVPIRMSCGVATYPVNGRLSHDLVGFADTNLYLSKQQGGDTITAGDTLERPDMTRTANFGVLDGLITAVDNKDHYTRQHSEDVARYATALARALGLSDDNQRTLRIAALLHDVGKIGVPDNILRKPGKLEDEEINILRQHAVLGEMIIKDVPNVADVIAAVGSHHERFDGSGYPRGLKGFEIPILGRILAVADAFSAMTTDRPYRKALSRSQARSELMRAAGTHLDFDLVRVFLRIRFTEDSLEEASA